jgi:hypothetical protein
MPRALEALEVEELVRRVAVLIFQTEREVDGGCVQDLPEQRTHGDVAAGAATRPPMSTATPDDS